MLKQLIFGLSIGLLGSQGYCAEMVNINRERFIDNFMDVNNDGNYDILSRIPKSSKNIIYVFRDNDFDRLVDEILCYRNKKVMWTITNLDDNRQKFPNEFSMKGYLESPAPWDSKQQMYNPDFEDAIFRNEAEICKSHEKYGIFSDAY